MEESAGSLKCRCGNCQSDILSHATVFVDIAMRSRSEIKGAKKKPNIM